jgi:hypothetical protein
MIHKKTLNARLIFSVMVPVSVIAFAAGIYTVGHDAFEYFSLFSLWDGLGLAIVAIGVFLFNIYEEKPQKASIENF